MASDGDGKYGILDGYNYELAFVFGTFSLCFFTSKISKLLKWKAKKHKSKYIDINTFIYILLMILSVTYDVQMHNGC